MNYSTVLNCLAHDQDGIVFDVGSVYERLCGLVDPRHRRGIRYVSGAKTSWVVVKR